MEITIRRRALLSMLAGARAAYPNEFLCLLTGERKKGAVEVDDTLIPPGIMVSETMSSFSEWMLPTIDGMIGTFHSHPGGALYPSAQDKRLYSRRGGVNFIAVEPFDENSTACFTWNGKKAAFRVVD